MTRPSKGRAKRLSVPAKAPVEAPVPGWQEPYSPYHELPFVVQDKATGIVTSWWSVPELSGEEGPVYSAGWDIGRGFAASAIQVLRECRGYTDCDLVMAVVEEMMPRKLTNIEKGFFWAISEYIASGAINMTCNMEAVFTSAPKPYTGDLG